MRRSRNDAVCSLPVRNMCAFLRYVECTVIVHRPSVFTEKRSKTRYTIRDATLSERVPVNRGIDRDHRFVDPEFCDAGEESHCKVRPDLHDGIAQLLFTYMSNLHRTATLQPLQRDIQRLVEIVIVLYRIIWNVSDR